MFADAKKALLANVFSWLFVSSPLGKKRLSLTCMFQALSNAKLRYKYPIGALVFKLELMQK